MKDCISGKPVAWRQQLPAGWHGSCAVCRRRLDERSFEREEVVALVEGPVIVALCATHVQRADQRDRWTISRRVAYCLALARWEHAWEQLAEQGSCDALGGAEYRRLRVMWHQAGRPDARAFIIAHANKGASTL